MGFPENVDTRRRLGLRDLYIALNRRMLLAALEALQPAPEQLDARGLPELFGDIGIGLREVGAIVARVAAEVNGPGLRVETLHELIGYLREKCEEAEARLRVLGVTISYGKAVLS